MTPEWLSWGAAWVLLLVGVLSWREAHREAPPAPHCAAPRLLEQSEEGTSVLCATRASDLGSDLPRVEGSLGLLFGRPLDLNRASAADLQALPGIGPARAEAIVAQRNERPFCSVPALTRVRGIGPRSVEGLVGWVRASCANGEATQ